MKPAFNVATRDPVRDLQSLQAILNRDAFRTHHITTPLDTVRTGELAPTYYFPVHAKFEDGEVIRRAQFIVPTAYRISNAGPWLTVGVGLQARGEQDETTFRLLGTEWDTRLHTYTIGSPFTLLREETAIPRGAVVVVRVKRLDFPATTLLGACVETSIGYQGVS